MYNNPMIKATEAERLYPREKRNWEIPLSKLSHTNG
jgi:hypothetical protein